MKKTMLALANICAAIVCLFSCSPITKVADGSSSETVIGYIVNPDGSGAPHTIVKLIPSQYNPLQDSLSREILVDTTDSKGFYRFLVFDTGVSYSLYAVHRENNTCFLHTGILLKTDTTLVSPGALAATGTVQIPLPDTFATTGGYVFVPGTLIKAYVSPHAKSIAMDSLPAGTLPNISFSSNTFESQVIRYDVVVQSQQTTVVSNLSWLYAEPLYLNTTVSGANVLFSVYNFPVLIRLSAANFDFSKARPDGKDLRFTKQDNTELAFEMAQWDPIAQVAEIWVKVDTVFGNDSSQSITMYWGASTSSATPDSNASEVFDTANGFSGVWHLDANCLDATPNHNDGTNFGATDVPGMMGVAKKFRGSDSIRINGLLGSPQIITLSAWVNIDTTVADGQEIISLGDAVLLRADATVSNLGTEGSSHYIGDTSFFKLSSGRYLAKTGWHYLAFSYDNSIHQQRLYIDGIVAAAAAIIDSIDYAGVGRNTFIGAHGNAKTIWNSHGIIDEARICHVARSADWINLCYMNQKNGDMLVKFK
jgi:hypothetical protein